MIYLDIFNRKKTYSSLFNGTIYINEYGDVKITIGIDEFNRNEKAVEHLKKRALSSGESFNVFVRDDFGIKTFADVKVASVLSEHSDYKSKVSFLIEGSQIDEDELDDEEG